MTNRAWPAVRRARHVGSLGRRVSKRASAMNAPKRPQLGMITAFSYRDGVGRIQLADRTELRVGGRNLTAVVSFDAEERPLVGVRVEVHEVAPHPLGGFRATKVTRIGKEVSFARVTSPSQWEKKLREAGLSDAHATQIRAAMRPAAQLSIKKAACRNGASKIGGPPDVPSDFMWPTHEESPLAFVAQVRLSDVSATVARDLALPSKGLLSFFLGADGEAAVLHFAAGTRLSRMTPPFDALLEEHSVRVMELWTPPDLESADELFTGDTSAARIYEAAWNDHQRAQGDSPLHRVGGYAVPVQDSPELDGERLLLQLDSDDAADLMWEDMGRLVFLFAPARGFASARSELQSG